MIFEVSLLAGYLTVSGAYLGYLRHLGIKVANSESSLINKLEREFRHLERQTNNLTRIISSDRGFASHPGLTTVACEMSVLSGLIKQRKRSDIENRLTLLSVALSQLCAGEQKYVTELSSLEQTLYVMRAVARRLNIQSSSLPNQANLASPRQKGQSAHSKQKPCDSALDAQERLAA